MEKRLENIKASTVFQVQWFANSENYNAAASVISQGKRVFQQVNDSVRRDTVLADTIPMLRISRNARILPFTAAELAAVLNVSAAKNEEG